MKRIRTLVKKATEHLKSHKQCECVYCGSFFPVKFVKSEKGRARGCEYLCPMCRAETRKDIIGKSKEAK